MSPQAVREQAAGRGCGEPRQNAGLRVGAGGNRYDSGGGAEGIGEMDGRPGARGKTPAALVNGNYIMGG